MFSLTRNLTQSGVEILPVEILWKKVHSNNVDFSTIKIASKKVSETTWIFRPSKLHGKKYVQKTWIFRPAKLCRKKYVEKTLDFSIIEITSRKVRGNNVGFRSAKLHRKSTWKWRGNFSKFGLWRIDVILTWYRRWFNVACS